MCNLACLAEPFCPILCLYLHFQSANDFLQESRQVNLFFKYYWKVRCNMSKNIIYRNILKNMQEGVLSVDLKGRITTFNRAAEQILNLEASQVIGQIFGQVLFSLDGSDDFVQAILNTIYDSETIYHKRIRFPLANRVRLLAMTTSFLYADETAGRPGVKTGVIAVFADITAAEQLKEALKALKEIQVEQLVRAYRQKGHVLSTLDPLGFVLPGDHDDLKLQGHGLDDTDLETPFSVLLGSRPVTMPLKRILEEMEQIYCRAVGVQYMHIDDLNVQQWLREKIENPDYRQSPSRETQIRILRKLTDAEAFETFLQKNFTDAKRFSLEGAETLIPLLDQAIERAGSKGVEDIVIGMSHRGRLNVLVNLLGLPAKEIFRRLGHYEAGDSGQSAGDVPVHLGQETTHVSDAGKPIRLSLCFNPSHLEFVGPVVLGRVRARQDRLEGNSPGKVLPLIIHGDAAIAGQGINQELFNLSGLCGYTTGGAVHVIVNNQIGFTTPPDQSRSTHYASDVARMLQIPIFHVNGERPEAVDQVIRLALDFWKTWQRDVIVDLYCFRRHGHMELDDPKFTQPLLSEVIRQRPPIREAYMSNLVGLGQISLQEAAAIAEGSDRALKEELARGKSRDHDAADTGESSTEQDMPDTCVAEHRLLALLKELSTLPDGFLAHPKVTAILKRRIKMSQGKQPIDWAAGEALAYASLLCEGQPVRISGQDSLRGTFGHRHAVLFDQKTGKSHTPLVNLSRSDAVFSIFNSPLSEAGVLGFEFGYSIDVPDGLVIWEAQFGDFANGAQVIIDQFISSSEVKWQQSSGLCLFLPHGLEGAGPEHSSARPERFLQLAACNNMDIVFLSTAAQVFHRLRRQVLSSRKRPLIVFTPKSMLHRKTAGSPLEEFTCGAFTPILSTGLDGNTKKLIICCGQLGAELEKERLAGHADTGILRLEQLYPFPGEELTEILAGLPDLTHIVWAQEEPENMGPWHWIRTRLADRLKPGQHLTAVTRPECPSPATGSRARHRQEHTGLISALFP
jgi:2-oxoglutarate dehydrogenase E1 component